MKDQGRAIQVEFVGPGVIPRKLKAAMLGEWGLLVLRCSGSAFIAFIRTWPSFLQPYSGTAPLATQNTSGRAIETHKTGVADDVIFWSGATERPVIGKSASDKKAEEIGSTRKNEKHGQSKIERLVVSSSGDLAYEYGSSTIEFDDTQSGKHESFSPTYLRVWKRDGSVWRVAAAFFRPNPSKICPAE